MGLNSGNAISLDILCCCRTPTTIQENAEGCRQAAAAGWAVRGRTVVVVHDDHLLVAASAPVVATPAPAAAAAAAPAPAAAAAPAPSTSQSPPNHISATLLLTFAV